MRRMTYLAAPDYPVADAGAGIRAGDRSAGPALCPAWAGLAGYCDLDADAEPVSPNHLFGEAMLAVLSPSTRTLGPVFIDQLRGALIGAPLSLSQSLLICWPQTVCLIAGTIALFVAGYVVFQRQEVRA